MPTYDYRCRDCGHTVEIMHSFAEDGPEACERCRGPVERVLHPAGVIFRGSGFYVTDSRKGAATSEASGGDGGSDSGGSSKEKSAKEASPKETSPKAADSSGSKDSGRSDGGSG